MSLLFKLPEYYTIEILSQWCNLVDLGNVDTSVCNHIERQSLLHIFPNSGFIKKVTKRQSKVIHYMCRRMIKIDKLKVDAMVFANHVDDVQVSRLKELIIDAHAIPFDGFTKLAHLILSTNNNLRLMRIDYSSSAGLVSTNWDCFWTNMSSEALCGLESIAIRSAYDPYWISACAYLIQHCHSLKNITFSGLRLGDGVTCDGQLRQLFYKHKDHLTRIKIDLPKTISLETIELIGRSCHALEKLVLRMSGNRLPLSAFKTIITGCCHLQYLKLASDLKIDCQFVKSNCFLLDKKMGSFRLLESDIDTVNKADI